MNRVSIVIVTWNSASVLPLCLKKLQAQTVKDFEVIVVDNGSNDGSVEDLQDKWPALDLQVIRLEKNQGFAAANNVGARKAKGEWLALLNSDAYPEPDWLKNLLNAAEQYSGFSFFASRLLQAKSSHLLDGTGDVYHLSGLAWRRYSGWPAASYGLAQEEVFGPCAAAALYSRQAFLDIGGFDEDFFSYHEDVDLSFRLRMRGFRCLYVPDAIVEHVGSFSKGIESEFVLYHGHRNIVWSFFQNMPGWLFWIALPFHLAANFIFLIYYTVKGKGKVLWKGKIDAFRSLPMALRKRKYIQAHRSVAILEIWRAMEHGLLQPYLLGYNARKRNRESIISYKITVR